ncbi:hypothetical protein ACI2JA_15750 [Alkalihalobacillus sp. NPDC078783]
MRKTKIMYSQKFWISTLLLTVVVISILVYNSFSFILSNWFTFLNLTLGVLGTVATLYNYWRKFNLWVNKIIIILRNSNSTWNIIANYVGSFDESVIREIKRNFDAIDEVDEIEIVSDKTFRIYLNGLPLYFSYSDMEDANGDLKGNLTVRIRDFHASYEKATSLLNETIVPILDRVKEITGAKNTDNTYKFTISFGEKNPFVGLAVKNVDMKTISNFSYSYNRPVTFGTSSVTISNKSIICVTNSLRDFQNSSVNFLTLVGD